MSVGDRLSAWRAAGWVRLRDSSTAILQITVTATAAYAFAQFVLGHQQPLLAAIVAINALGFARDARPVRVLETVIAMSLGIALAELLLIGFGAGVWQFAVALALTLAVARLLSGNAAFAIAAAIQSTLVMLVPPPPGGPFVRTIDGLVGGAFALVATAIIPRDARRTSIRDGRRLIDEHIAVLGGLAEALRAGRTEIAGQALSRARATQPLVDAWMSSVDSGVAIARVSPISHRWGSELERQRAMLSELDLATRNLRAIARRIAWILRDGRARPAIADSLERIAVAVGFLGDSLRDVSSVAVARQALTEIARHLDPVSILPDGPPGDRVTIVALRPYLVDLLTATGLDPEAARTVLPAE